MKPSRAGLRHRRGLARAPQTGFGQAASLAAARDDVDVELRHDIAERRDVELVAVGDVLERRAAAWRSRPSTAPARSSSRSMISTSAWPGAAPGSARDNWRRSISSTRDSARSPTGTVSRASLRVERPGRHGVHRHVRVIPGVQVANPFDRRDQDGSRAGDRRRVKRAHGSASDAGRACFPPLLARYRRREVGGGRATRQPGQVRKEAALTSFGSGRSSSLPPIHETMARARFSVANRMAR